MRLIFAAALAAACLFTSPAGAAAALSGNSYLDFCGRKDRTICEFYTVGVVDGIIATRFLDPDREGPAEPSRRPT